MAVVYRLFVAVLLPFLAVIHFSHIYMYVHVHKKAGVFLSMAGSKGLYNKDPKA